MFIIFLLLALFFSFPAAAGSFEVAPTTLHLPAGQKAEIFYITNRGAQPIVTQIEGYIWTQNENGDQLDPTDKLLFSPPMTRLEPEHQQTVRIAAKPDAGAAHERAFRLIVSEIPDATQQYSGDVHVLLQFSMPVFVPGSDTTPPKLAWHAAQNADGLTLTAQNTGATHIKLSDLTVEKTDGEKIEVAARHFDYVLADAARSWQIKNNDLAPGTSLTVSFHDDDGGKTLHESILVE